jgi:hypothetical protein
MRTRDYGLKPPRTLPIQRPARVIPIRMQPLPDPRVVFVATNHVCHKEDESESLLVFYGKPGHLLSLPYPGQGSVVVAAHQSVLVLGNGGRILHRGKTDRAYEQDARTVVRFRWDGVWTLEPLHPDEARGILALALPTPEGDAS